MKITSRTDVSEFRRTTLKFTLLGFWTGLSSFCGQARAQNSLWRCEFNGTCSTNVYQGVGLPVGFTGVDIKSLSENISRAPSQRPKSEFETTDSYKDRIAKFPVSDSPMFLKQGEFVAVVFGKPTDSPLESPFSVKYDADHGTFSCGLAFRSRRMYLEPDQPIFDIADLQHEILDSDQYRGTNAFGATVEVTKLRTESYGVAVDPLSWIFGQTGRTVEARATVNFSASSEEAEMLKPQLRVALLGYLEPPWLVTDHSGADATFSSPIEVVGSQHYIVIFPMELVLFRADTGKILQFVTSQGVRTPQQIPHAATAPFVPLIPYRLPDDVISGDTPRQLTMHRLTGDVQLDLSIDESGAVTAWSVVSGQAILVAAAIRAVKTWKFKPYQVNGVPAPHHKSVTLHFDGD